MEQIVPSIDTRNVCVLFEIMFFINQQTNKNQDSVSMVDKGDQLQLSVFLDQVLDRSPQHRLNKAQWSFIVCLSNRLTVEL